jgi:hypothetical protein
MRISAGSSAYFIFYCDCGPAMPLGKTQSKAQLVLVRAISEGSGAK